MRKPRFIATLLPRISLLVLVLTLLPLQATAVGGQLSPRSVTVSSSAPSGTAVTYTFNFTIPAADLSTAVKSADIFFCTTASGTCTTPAGITTTGASLSSQPTNLGAAAGWTGTFTTNGRIQIANASNATVPSGAQTLVFGGITNPSAANTTYFARITTYSDATWGTTISSGTVATSTANQIQVTASIDETLTFCVYTGANCGAGGGAVALGTLGASQTNEGTSKMDVATNANSGYVVTANGTTLTSGANTIPAMTSAGAPNVSGNTSQFGINLKANNVASGTPSTTFGADPTSGTNTFGSVPAGYNTANTFKYNTGDTIAQSTQPTNANTFTISYIANISSVQAAGRYTTTLTYICTATF